MLSDMGTSSWLRVRGTFCSCKVPSSHGTGIFTFSNCKTQGSFCVEVAQVMPQTSFFTEDAWPQQETCYQADHAQVSAVGASESAKCLLEHWSRVFLQD